MNSYLNFKYDGEKKTISIFFFFNVENKWLLVIFFSNFFKIDTLKKAGCMSGIVDNVLLVQVLMCNREQTDHEV